MPSRPLIWIREQVLVEIRREAERHYPLETGGVLLGYLADETWVVTDALGPGPRARHRRRSFEPDHGWHAAELVRRFEATQGRDYYIGDWHTHPDGAPRLSAKDRRAIRRVIASKAAATHRPLSALVAGAPGDWVLSAWSAQLARFCWRPASLRIEALQPRLF